MEKVITKEQQTFLDHNAIKGKTKEELHAHMISMMQKSLVKRKLRKEMKIDQLAQFVAQNPFSTMKEKCETYGISWTNRRTIYWIMRDPIFQEQVKKQAESMIDPMVARTIGEKYEQLAIMAVDKMEQRVLDKNCKDNTLVEVLRVCSQFLTPKNPAVMVNAGSGSWINMMAGLPSSSQEVLEKEIPIEGSVNA